MMKKICNLLMRIYYVYIKRDNVAFAKKLGVRIGKKCQILANPQKCFGTEPWLITLGDHVDVTADVRFLTHEGALWCVRELCKEYADCDLFAPTVVGDNVLIGLGTLIMPGVHIGNNVVIAAHSVVTKDIEDGMIVAGIPAKPISTIERFIEKLPSRDLFHTKKMSAEEKRKYLKYIHPEWF